MDADTKNIEIADVDTDADMDFCKNADMSADADMPRTRVSTELWSEVETSFQFHLVRSGKMFSVWYGLAL